MTEPSAPLPRAHPRKQPRQSRAQSTVQRLLTATETLIAEQGMAALTTNRIAEQAGVNIASLYQYFPNKEAVVALLAERWLQDITQRLSTLLHVQADLPIPLSTRLWCQAALTYCRERPVLQALLLRIRERPEDWPGVRQLEFRLQETMRRFLLPRRDTLATPDLDLAIHVIYTTASALVLRQLSEALPYYRDEQIIEEVVQLVSRYLQTPSTRDA